MANNISLRDYFAGKALQGLLASNYIIDTMEGYGKRELMKEASKVAYIVADEMIKERIKAFPEPTFDRTKFTTRDDGK